MMLHLDANKCINDEILAEIFDEFTGMDRAFDYGGPRSESSVKFSALVICLKLFPPLTIDIELLHWKRADAILVQKSYQAACLGSKASSTLS